MIEKHGVVTVIDNKGVHQRKMTNQEINHMIGKLRFNNGFSLPDELVQDFINDGSVVPTFKKCVNFNRRDFNSIIEKLEPKNRRKRLPPRKTKRIRKVKPQMKPSKFNKSKSSKIKGSRKRI